MAEKRNWNAEFIVEFRANNGMFSRFVIRLARRERE